MQTLMASGLSRVLVTDWKSATHEMRNFDIDKYLSDIDTIVETLGGTVHLVGLCQGGWMSAMYACRFPGKIACEEKNYIQRTEWFENSLDLNRL